MAEEDKFQLESRKVALKPGKILKII